MHVIYCQLSETNKHAVFQLKKGFNKFSDPPRTYAWNQMSPIREVGP